MTISRPDLPRVHTHTLLRGMGGTSAVARAVHRALDAAGTACAFCYECDDSQGGDDDLEVPPEEAGIYAARSGAGIVHVHASTDWAACMEGLADSGARVVATLHDCRAFTGGCPYSLDCGAWEVGCLADCPRLFPHADEVAARKRRAVEAAEPLLVAPSRWMARLTRTVWPDLEVRIVPNGVPWPSRLPGKGPTRRGVGVAPGARMVLFAAHGGADAAYKQGRAFLKAFQAVKRQVPEALCYVVGGESMERRGDVIFLPYVDAQAMARLMRAADVLALPSLADNHPLVVLEAMSMGLPVVAFASGGIPEQIRDGMDGLLAPTGDWDGLTRALVRLLSDPAEARRMGDTARTEGERRFSEERMAAGYLKLYARLAG